MKNTLLTLGLIATYLTANAQISISPVVGLDVTGYSSNARGTSYVTTLHPGPCAGALIDVPLKGILSPQFGVIYKMYAYSHTGILQVYGGPPRVEDYRYTFSRLDIPVKLIYSFPAGRGNRFFVGTGPYAAVSVSETISINTHYYDAAGNEVNSDKRVVHQSADHIDVGWGINGGFRAAKGLLICLQGQYSLIDHLQGYHDYHSYNFGVLAGYTVKRKKHKEQTTNAVGKTQ